MRRTPKTPGHRTASQASGRPVVAITHAAIQASERYLRAAFWGATERIVYWAGVKRPDVWVVTTVIRPDAIMTRGSFETSAAANAAVVTYLSDAGLSLIGQIHTHPGSFVDHSAGDDEDAFMPIENSVSIVVPNYGREGMLPLNRCGVHRYEAGVFRRLHGAEVAIFFCVVPLTRDFAHERTPTVPVDCR